MTEITKRPKPLLLVILDGFGVSKDKQGNPAAEASTPTFHEIETRYPFITLQASGIAVGLPMSEAGNSEVGHLTIGAGRVLYHHLPRIISSIADGSFYENRELKRAASHVNNSGSRLHIAGLVSSGSVHSYLEHLYALLEFAKRERIEKVFLHIFTDGRDAPPEEGAQFLTLLEERTKQEWPNVAIATVVGRFWAMDRDNHWNRVKKAYDLIAEGKGNIIRSVKDYLSSSYASGVSDEFIEPAVILGDDGNPKGEMRSGDALIFFNFREDSMREFARAFADPSFKEFKRALPQNLLVLTMTEYEKGQEGVVSIFPRIEVKNPLAEILGNAGMSHLHVAESDKYAHVTYFLNGGREEPYPGEERILIPSFSTAHFDQVPEMRSPEITETILHNFNRFDVIIANYANADMVGHAGDFSAAVKAVEILDEEMKKLMQTIKEGGGAAVITADHGNIEMKRNSITGERMTKHSLAPVPFYLIGNEYRRESPRSAQDIDEIISNPAGILTDIAPTILELLGLSQPMEMTGKSFLKNLLQ